MKSYKELIVWQKGIELVEAVYKLTKRLPQEELFVLGAQVRRSAISIPSNIAEGAARNTTKEYLRFLYIAYGSASELETQLIIVKDIYPRVFDESIMSLLIEIQKMLNKLISKLTTNH